MSWCSNLMLLFPRMAPADKSKYVPDMVGSLKGRPANHQNTLLRMIAPLLGDVQMPTDPKAKESLYGLDKVRGVSACGRMVARAAAVINAAHAMARSRHQTITTGACGQGAAARLSIGCAPMRAQHQQGVCRGIRCRRHALGR
jgi:hypothetical protein